MRGRGRARQTPMNWNPISSYWPSSGFLTRCGRRWLLPCNNVIELASPSECSQVSRGHLYRATPRYNPTNLFARPFSFSGGCLCNAFRPHLHCQRLHATSITLMACLHPMKQSMHTYNDPYFHPQRPPRPHATSATSFAR
jgi:hypothetical protein